MQLAVLERDLADGRVDDAELVGAKSRLVNFGGRGNFRTAKLADGVSGAIFTPPIRSTLRNFNGVRYMD